ncbi:hypothetical protein CXG81DRAFT_12177 [Caulochytrium protostelioides]|uniref:Adaptin ear-binding coat-associated protein 1 NECAP-1 n=1 Tax=Caulochytrium protostelioides TaxID=1555241 RepID=A0A4P9X7T3_9FUNG|nr:adaptin ear-binding coat-associated protein 1 NECAP-1 [Caulochytrium protostelioides]RKP01295.1 hypothetical protein CXG81DRAFT_12177 [Caulochytrium protostelioides]|eukprot:RKP01295.1 hypothetical protein CXG81DRAFT_12177 [Caulochytrium protostelioides]
MTSVERTLLVVPKVNIYSIPPLVSSRGYRASDWPPEAHIWTGRLRVLISGAQATIALEDAATGELFASCPYDGPRAVEPVTDSSRYFVIRVVNTATSQRAFLGLGFDDRSDAFDLNVVLQDFAR